MFKKLIALYMSFYLVLPCIIPVNVAFAQNNKEYTIAILNLDAKGVSQVESEVLSERLRSYVSQLLNSPEYNASGDKDRYLVVEQTQVDKILEQFEIQNIGCVSDSCAIEFGKMLQVDRIVIGQVGRVGNTYSVSARIIDVESRKSMATADRQLRGSIDDVMSSVIMEVGDELFIGSGKKSKKMWYIVGGALLVGAGVAASISGKKNGDGAGVSLPLPPERP